MIAAASLLMLGSGAAHAVVNAILKSGGDKMSSRALIDGSSATTADQVDDLVEMLELELSEDHIAALNAAI